MTTYQKKLKKYFKRLDKWYYMDYINFRQDKSVTTYIVGFFRKTLKHKPPQEFSRGGFA